MPKYVLERAFKNGIIIDKLTFKNTNIAIKYANEWIEDDHSIIKVTVKMIDPESKYTYIVSTKQTIIETHFKLKESDNVSIRSKIGENRGNEDEKKACILDKRGAESSSYSTDHKK